MGIRPGRAVRNIQKVAWTRYSRSKPKKSYIKAMPHQDLNVFRMGVDKKDFDSTLNLVCDRGIIIRDNAIESARQTINKYLEKTMPGDYYFIVRVFPHHVIRENKMIAGAGADRLQKGMRQSFGRPTDKAARIHKGTELFTVRCRRDSIQGIKLAFQRATKKLSGTFSVSINA
jgi:large subunit ribosomal protein L10e